MYTDVSDHFPVYHIDYSEMTELPSKNFKKKVYSIENRKRFSNSMLDKNWDSVLNNNNVQNKYSVFHRELCDVYDTCFSVKTYKYGYLNRKPWLS